MEAEVNERLDVARETELARAGHLDGYASTVRAGLLLLRNPHLLD